MAARAPRGPRRAVKQETPAQPSSEVPPANQIEAHGAIAVLEAPEERIPVESFGEHYSGRFLKCRKPLKLAGEKYMPGDDVPADLIPRVESWIATGFLLEG